MRLLIGPFITPLATLGVTSESHFADPFGVTFAFVHCQSPSKIKYPLVYRMMEWTLFPSGIESMVYAPASWLGNSMPDGPRQPIRHFEIIFRPRSYGKGKIFSFQVARRVTPWPHARRSTHGGRCIFATETIIVHCV